MRQVNLLATVALLACVASAKHLETVFSVTMPYSETYAQGAVVFGDAIYVACGPSAAVVEAVNLTTRMNMWMSPNYTTTYGQINVFVATTQAVLLGFNSAIIALSPTTGQQLWVQSGYQLEQSAAFAYGNTIYAQVILPSNFYALQAFDAATGNPGYFQYGNDMVIDGNTAFVAHYSLNGNMIVNEVLSAIDIPTNTTLWTVPCNPPQTVFPTISSEYVAFSNMSGSDEIAVVLHRKNGSVAQAFQAFNGFATYGVSSFVGNKLFALVGGEYPRYVLADLTTGYITWTRSAAEVGYGGILSGDALVSVSQSLVLTITTIDSTASSITVPQVPSLPNPTLVNFGSGLVQVGNLQGYTLWDTNTGNFVGSNEQAPNAVLSMPLKWNGLSIFVSGNIVSAMKVTN